MAVYLEEASKVCPVVGSETIIGGVEMAVVELDDLGWELVEVVLITDVN